MSFDLLPHPTSQPSQGRTFRRWRGFLRSNGVLATGIFFSAFIFASLIFYTSFVSPRGSLLRRPLGWHDLPHLDSNSSEHADSRPKYAFPSPSLSLSTSTILDQASPPSPSPSPPPPSESKDLTLEQIRDIVARTRGFFSRDYSLGLGWNNMRYIIDAALLQADLLNRTLVLPSFVYARACEYNITVCADYAPMINKGDAIGWDEWRELPIEQQMGFRIPISVMIDLVHLRKRHAVITVSDYLRLHGQDPENESSSGFWPRDWYQSHPDVFNTKLPSLFVIENHWYDPLGVNRVDYILPAMKRRGKWERYPKSETLESGGYWPSAEPTELSVRLASAMPEDKAILDWNTAKYVLAAAELGGEVNLDDDEVVEGVLNAHGWEVLHTFASTLGMEYAKTVVQSIKEVAPRSSIRGFKEDYYHVDADVVILAGETHLGRKPGAMRFTGPRGRANYASMVVHGIVPPRWVFDLGEILASRMRELVDGRLWMGAHMRRGDFVRLSWAMELSPEAHVLRVKNRLQAGRSVLEHLGELTTYDLDGVAPDLEQTALALPLPDDLFYVATDERDPNARQVIAEGGAVFISDLLTMEDRRRFGWPLMITDVLALVEQRLLVHSAFFYGHAMSSLAGVITNMRAARGADPRTMLID